MQLTIRVYMIPKRKTLQNFFPSLRTKKRAAKKRASDSDAMMPVAKRRKRKSEKQNSKIK